MVLTCRHQQKILQKHGHKPAPPPKPGGSSTSSHHAHKRAKTKDSIVASNKSAFQELFTQRASGFQIDFRFRNAPPRPPVGPTFVGHSLHQVLQEQCKQYKPLNSVEVNYTWKLHAEADLGVPLAPSAMDPKSYTTTTKATSLSDQPMLHPDDAALLDWKGSMGDTAADNLQRRREQTRAAARLALSGQRGLAAATAAVLNAAKNQPSRGRGGATAASTKKAFSRVLKEDLQTWMKKTTYLSNDYSRKVHDFKSLAQTKQELEEELKTKQQEITKRRSAQAIAQSFEFNLSSLQHPNPKNKHLKPKAVYEVLPNVEHWGRPFTQVVIDKKPIYHNLQAFDQALVAHVEKKQANARMTCQVFVPEESPNNNTTSTEKSYKAVQSYDLDVIPLKEEDTPAVHYCFWINPTTGLATYLPIASRVQLSTGRPVHHGGIRKISRRPLTNQEIMELEQRQAEVDRDMAEKHDIVLEQRRKAEAGKSAEVSKPNGNNTGGGSEDKKKDDDGEDDFGEDDSSDSGDEALFGGRNNKTIVAEG